VLIIEQNECDALVDGVVLGEVDRPAACLQQFAVVGFPLIADTGATVRDQAREIGMISDVLARLFERILNAEDKQRMPACRMAAVEHQSLRLVRRKPFRSITPGSCPSTEPDAAAIAVTACP
jgi:hypothetical protein